MASAIILPDNLSFCDWANQLGISINERVPVALAGQDWRDWANNLTSLKEFNVIPDPNQFKTWQDWARMLLKYKIF